jgi:hypothetical protein
VTSSSHERRAVRHQVREIHALWVAAPRDAEGEPRLTTVARDSVPWREPDGRICISPAGPVEGESDPVESAGARIDALASVLHAALGRIGDSPVLPEDDYVAEEGVRCEDEGCVACREPVRVPPAFLLTRTDPVLLTCVYCLSRRRARLVGSRQERRYHELTSGQVRKIKRRNTVFFATEEAAREAGFVPSKI